MICDKWKPTLCGSDPGAWPATKREVCRSWNFALHPSVIFSIPIPFRSSGFRSESLTGQAKILTLLNTRTYGDLLCPQINPKRTAIHPCPQIKPPCPHMDLSYSDMNQSCQDSNLQPMLWESCHIYKRRAVPCNRIRLRPYSVRVVDGYQLSRPRTVYRPSRCFDGTVTVSCVRNRAEQYETGNECIRTSATGSIRDDTKYQQWSDYVS